MIRTTSIIAALLVAFALPAGAQDATVKSPAASSTAPVAAAPAVGGSLFTEQQARDHLQKQGYTNITTMTKDDNGGWRGSATKDGKTLIVAVDVKGGVVNK